MGAGGKPRTTRDHGMAGFPPLGWGGRLSSCGLICPLCAAGPPSAPALPWPRHLPDLLRHQAPGRDPLPGRLRLSGGRPASPRSRGAQAAGTGPHRPDRLHGPPASRKCSCSCFSFWAAWSSGTGLRAWSRSATRTWPKRPPPWPARSRPPARGLIAELAAPSPGQRGAPAPDGRIAGGSGQGRRVPLSAEDAAEVLRGIERGAPHQAPGLASELTPIDAPGPRARPLRRQRQSPPRGSPGPGRGAGGRHAFSRLCIRADLLSLRFVQGVADDGYAV